MSDDQTGRYTTEQLAAAAKLLDEATTVTDAPSEETPVPANTESSNSDGPSEGVPEAPTEPQEPSEPDPAPTTTPEELEAAKALLAAAGYTVA